MKKLNFLGIGPKIAMGALPILALTIILSILYSGAFHYTCPGNRLVRYGGIVLLGGGFMFYAVSVRLLLMGLKETRLMTKGTYYLCRNPLYTSIILFIIPGVSLIMNTWLILSASVAGYILFRFFIKSEYSELETFFGEDYRNYAAHTPEFFPFPFRKIF